MKLWHDYQEDLNDAAHHSSIRHTDRRSEYTTRIRLLHQQRDQCLAAHCDDYFYSDVEAYLATATLSQMTSYLLQYEPAIQESVKAANQIQTVSLLQFAGFSRTRQPTAPLTKDPITHSSPRLTSIQNHPVRHRSTRLPVPSRWHPSSMVNPVVVE